VQLPCTANIHSVGIKNPTSTLVEITDQYSLAYSQVMPSNF